MFVKCREKPNFILAFIEDENLRKLLSSDAYGFFLKDGCSLPYRFKKQYRKMKVFRKKNILLSYILKEYCLYPAIGDIIELHKLLNKG